ncbi:MAG: aspartyl-phosphate phosphatase Spo0E family protein [Clostridia bacterium]|nr:aspartyl-phosphate phosphatase Spo0E family protein [Clostridia bacterium]
MLNEEICRLREKLNDSILNEPDYNITYQISVELDQLIAEYYSTEMKLTTQEKQKKHQKEKNLVAKN